MAPNLHLAGNHTGGVVNGNGNNKKKRRRLIIWGGVGLGIVLLIAVGVFAATRGGTKIDPSKLAKVEKGDLAKSVVATGKVDAHHEGRSEVEGQRHREEAAGGLRRPRQEGPAAGRNSTRSRSRRRWSSRARRWKRRRPT